MANLICTENSAASYCGSSPSRLAAVLRLRIRLPLMERENLYVADSITNEIIEFAGTSTISSTIVGTSLIGGLTGPKGVAVDASGNLYIAETGNVLVQPIEAACRRCWAAALRHRYRGCRCQRQRLCG